MCLGLLIELYLPVLSRLPLDRVMEYQDDWHEAVLSMYPNNSAITLKPEDIQIRYFYEDNETVEHLISYQNAGETQKTDQEVHEEYRRSREEK